MTTFEQALNYHQETLAQFSQHNPEDAMSSNNKELIFIAQALVAMSNDELMDGEMYIKVMKNSWRHANQRMGSTYIVKKNIEFVEGIGYMYTMRSGAMIRVSDCQVVESTNFQVGNKGCCK